MRKLHVTVNSLFIALALYGLIAATRKTHVIHPQLLLLLVPPVSAMLLKRYVRRDLGALALFANGLAFLGGVICAIAFLLGARAHGSVHDRLVLPTMAAILLLAGYLNTTAAWRAFPSKDARHAPGTRTSAPSSK